MDYRKPAVFGTNWSPSRYKVLPYFAVEKQVVANPAVTHILDMGCASGWNMSRFRQYGQPAAHLFGFDIVPERVKLAADFGQVLVASGLQCPFPDQTFDVIYIQHVLHHIGDVPQALREINRCLKPGGVLFLIETAEDNPLIHWGRRLYPNWLGDEVNAPFRFTELKQQLTEFGFTVEQAEQYSVLFWVWEILPDQFPKMEKLTPAFVWLEQQLVRWFKKYSAHCFYVARKRSSE